MKEQYRQPSITVIRMDDELMQHLSIGGGTTPSPGGGNAKPGWMMEEEDELQREEEYNMRNYEPWK